MRQSKEYTEEFKADAVRLSNSAEKSVRAIAEDLGISRHTVESWRRKQPKASSRKRDHVALKQPTMAELQQENQRHSCTTVPSTMPDDRFTATVASSSQSASARLSRSGSQSEVDGRANVRS